MKIVSLSEIIEANSLLENAVTNMRISICDACGGQSFKLKVINDSLEPQREKAVGIVGKYFSERGFVIKFTDDFAVFYVVE